MAIVEIRYAVVLLWLCGLTTVLGGQLSWKPSSRTQTPGRYHHGDPEPTQSFPPDIDSVTDCPGVCTCESHGIVYCRKRNLTDIPEGLPNDTLELHVDHNLLTSLDGHIFRNLLRLKTFIAHDNLISDVKKGTFSGLSQLEYVDLSNNPLLLPSLKNILCSMPYVPQTWLSLDAIFEHEQVALSNETFACLRQKQVMYLGLYNNNFGQFPDAVFSGMNVSMLVLSNTTSTRMNTVAFLGIIHIMELDLGLNDLRYFPKFILNGVKLIPNLKILHLDENPLERLTVEDMEGLTDLDTLTMNGVSNGFLRLYVEPGFTLDLLPNLEGFHFRDNRLSIRSQHQSLFQSKSLAYLIVGGSKFFLDDADFVMFRNMPNLQSLRANDITINTLQDPDAYKATAFQNLSNLMELYLSGNSLTDLPSNMFKGSSNIKTLDLSSNSLSTLRIGVFAGLHSLKSLDISSNDFHILDAGFFRPEGHYMSQLTSVTILGNPLVCSCSLLHFVEYVRRHLEIFQDVNETRCAYPIPLAGTILLNAPIHPSDCALGLPISFYISVAASGITLFLLLTGSYVYKYRWHIKYMYFQMKSKYAKEGDQRDLTNYTYDAFVSYNGRSIQWVKSILLPLLEEQMGLKVCLHDRDWLAGRDIVDNIVDSIEGSRKVILVVTNAFARSQWCHLELTMAQHHLLEKDKSNMILIKMEDIHDYNMSPRLALQMKTQTYIEWHENNAKAQELFGKKIKHAMIRPSASVRLQPV